MANRYWAIPTGRALVNRARILGLGLSASVAIAGCHEDQQNEIGYSEYHQISEEVGVWYPQLRPLAKQMLVDGKITKAEAAEFWRAEDRIREQNRKDAIAQIKSGIVGGKANG